MLWLYQDYHTLNTLINTLIIHLFARKSFCTIVDLVMRVSSFIFSSSQLLTNLSSSQLLTIITCASLSLCYYLYTLSYKLEHRAKYKIQPSFAYLLVLWGWVSSFIICSIQDIIQYLVIFLKRQHQMYSWQWTLFICCEGNRALSIKWI